MAPSSTHSSICWREMATGFCTSRKPSRQKSTFTPCFFRMRAASTNSPTPLSHSMRAISRKRKDSLPGKGTDIKRLRSIPEPGRRSVTAPGISFPETNSALSSSFWKNTFTERDKASRYNLRTSRVSQLSRINTVPRPAILLITGILNRCAAKEP